MARLVGHREAKPALRFPPIEFVQPGDDAQHAVRFRQIPIAFQCRVSELTRSWHHIIRASTCA
jgi:hypothetical protein